MLNRIETTYRELLASNPSIDVLFSGNPNEQGILFPTPILERAYQVYFQNPDYHPHPKGLLEAREAIAHYYSEQNLKVSPESICLTSGSSESFFHLFSILTEIGDHVLAPLPSYPLFDHIAQMARIELKHYHLQEQNSWKVDLEDLKGKTNEKTKAILLVSPHNPTGSVLSIEELNEIVSWANDREIALICDEVFSEFYFGKGSFPRVAEVTQPRLCFTLNGLSKMLALPALKLSWILVTGDHPKIESYIDRLETACDTFLSCHTPIQKALPDLLINGKEFLNSYRMEVDHRRQMAIQQLSQISQISFTEPLGGFYMMMRLNLPNYKYDEEAFVIQLMREKQIFVHPGYYYDHEDGIHLVISFLTEPDRMKRGIKRLKDLIQ